jgi:hypothetical protein
MALIDVYTSVMTPDVAAERMAKLRKSGLDKIAFAWPVGRNGGRSTYYRIQGPTFLVEYDNAQNDGNHIHSVWRDFDGDFGRDLLREHLKGVPHLHERRPVTVLTTSDPGLLAFAQSLLEARASSSSSKGKNHRIVPFIGFAELQVGAADADEAQTLLADLKAQEDHGRPF